MRRLATAIIPIALLWLACAGGAFAADQPDIIFSMADDVGIMNVGAYHRGLMVEETPNIDRIANEGGMFMDYYAM